MFLRLAQINGKGFKAIAPGKLSQGFTSSRGIKDKNLTDSNTPFSKAQNTIAFDRIPSPLEYTSKLIKSLDKDKEFKKDFYVENPEDPAILNSRVFKYTPEERKKEDEGGNFKIGNRSIDFRNEISKYEKFEDYFIDARLAKLLELAQEGKLTKNQKNLITQFIGINPQTQEIERRTPKGGINRKAFGFTYEHVTPVSFLRKLSEFISNERLKNGEEEKIDSDIQTILDKMHRITLLGKSGDQNVGKVNQSTIPTDLEQKLGVKDVGLKKPLEYYNSLPKEKQNPDYIMSQIKSLNDDQVFSRYTRQNIPKPVSLNSILPSENSNIELKGLNRGDLGIKKSEVFENIIFEQKLNITTHPKSQSDTLTESTIKGLKYLLS